ncbi:MAG: bifunctional phosphoribosyl-AMP cyclohydrolase/phosphoribosyl-ATP diphosphatase HisIE [Chloroflexi bacterium AL-W]|nr:bifunctional phosphoribosyl-AMP cyclohydrolase/phosphoribosyl-ATP diphosphatase HisIE [Chloroflexi bacterium AL-N1]NOK69947.1 bifunctional phosphoribosyl-AMP cyclohydrolase/phosphoribosyl-ATP diphosphatase HisIE [Chloroflexi bacterium AL-N10]NOK73756.1 bifunctional phosphoribosyl-AMP cyclohydrolase/phosphoribosyl-ATP diphosphatase HisIE [Chloroflexi bacterium AL-N5]NOK85479.1 bifunctional phosphoribosyl-AMP cyclohydrolase/phosphoribosyl-ATP diphosphatase HisIE [Chloroflexi bacterium AL-W]NOK
MKFDEKGLIPAIVQHVRSGEVLMLGYMNEEALQHTVETRLVTFWSRSRNELWQKGMTSGNVLQLVEIRQDCDGDALLILAEPAGPTCHTGAVTCFHISLDNVKVDMPAPTGAIISQLMDLIHQRSADRPEGSYTTKLLDGGVDRIGKKIGEEAAEVIIAAKNESQDELTWELADLFYHSMVLLVQQGVSEQAVWNELWRRHGT